MSLIVCTVPGCDTSAGCKCAAPVGLERLLSNFDRRDERIARLTKALERIATDPNVSCLAANPALWPSTIAQEALGPTRTDLETGNG
jgi:hypothetical protein